MNWNSKMFMMNRNLFDSLFGIIMGIFEVAWSRNVREKVGRIEESQLF